MSRGEWAIDRESVEEAASQGPPPVPPAAADRYRAALRKRSVSDLGAILQTLGSFDRTTKPSELIPAIYERMEEVRFVEGLIGRLAFPARLALGLFALTESPLWPRAGLAHAMASLGAEIDPAMEELAPFGLVLADQEGEADVVVAHPTVL